MDPRDYEHRPVGERWLDEAAGPVVRPYAMTRGRTTPRGVRLDLVTILVATGTSPTDQMRVSPEQRRLLLLAGRPTTVADLASEMDLPLGVVRVLLGDLLQSGLLSVPQFEAPRPPAPRRRADPLLTDTFDPLDPAVPLDPSVVGDAGPTLEPAAPPSAFPERPDRLLLTRVLNDLRSL